MLPYFMGDRSRDLAQLAEAEVIEVALPGGSQQQRMGVLYAALAERVATTEAPRVQAGDCVSSLGVAAGLQRRGLEPFVVWLDAHGDFNTWETTPSGFLGGMPLAMMVGLGEQDHGRQPPRARRPDAVRPAPGLVRRPAASGARSRVPVDVARRAGAGPGA